MTPRLSTVKCVSLRRKIPMKRLMHSALFVLMFWLASCATVTPGNEALITEEFTIPAVDSGVGLYVRNKRPTSMSQFPAEHVVLFVHGSTYPAETVFDLPLNGMSWMDYIARHGYDVYLVD